MAFDFVRVFGPTRKFENPGEHLRIVMAAYNGNLDANDATSAFEVAYDQLKKVNRSLTAEWHSEDQQAPISTEPGEIYVFGFVEENTMQKYWIAANPRLINTGGGGGRGSRYISSIDPNEPKESIGRPAVVLNFDNLVEISFVDNDQGGIVVRIHPLV
jgi:hypothetical protein